MRIELNREKKIMLLQALQRGYIEDDEVRGWLSYDTATAEEIESELDRLTKATHPDTCKRVQRLGLCLYCKHPPSPMSDRASR